MIEAVNSVLSAAPVLKAAVEQQSVVRSFAANPVRVQEVALAPYISPYIKVDVNFDKAVLQLRDSETGDVVRQIPTEGQLEAYRRAQQSANTSPKPKQFDVTSVTDTSGPSQTVKPQQTPVAAQVSSETAPSSNAPVANVSAPVQQAVSSTPSVVVEA